MPGNTRIALTRPRETAQVALPDGRVFEGPVGTPLADFFATAFPASERPVMAALVHGDLVELTYPVMRDAAVLPLDTSTNDGMRIYQRSVSFVLIVAIRELFPEVRVIMDHSLTMGGFFCQVVGREPFSDAEHRAIEQRMRAIVAADEPITRERIPVAEAQQMFASQGYEDKVRLLAFRDQDQVPVYALRGVRDYFYGYMAPSTGALRYFAVEPYRDGTLLRLPSRLHPNVLPPRRDYPKLYAVFREYGRWLRILGIEDVGSLNQAIVDGRGREAILVSEALHEKHISQVADDIARQRERVRLVLIAGPSSSGKTTFARRLAIQLMVNGLRPYALGLDDYFVDRDQTPRDAQGQRDYEALEAVNLPLFNRQLTALLAGETVRPPRYDFVAGKSRPGDPLRLPADAVLIVEGIHGLNPDLVPAVPDEAIYRIYVSALTQLNIDHHNRVPTTDTRLLRRIVRDAAQRGYDATGTIERWESVRRGEERSIFPYQENADVMFNSALAYELAVIKPLVEPLLLRVPRGTMAAIEARRLLGFLRWVQPCGAELVPDNSLLREFIGGSILSDFSFGSLAS